MRVANASDVVPAKAGTYTPKSIEELRSMGPGSPSLRSVPRDGRE